MKKFITTFIKRFRYIRDVKKVNELLNVQFKIAEEHLGDQDDTIFYEALTNVKALLTTKKMMQQDAGLWD